MSQRQDCIEKVTAMLWISRLVFWLIFIFLAIEVYGNRWWQVAGHAAALLFLSYGLIRLSKTKKQLEKETW